MLPTYITDDGIIKSIARHLQRRRHGNTVHAQHGNIRSTAAHIHNHVAVGVLDIQARTQRGCQGLLNKEHTAGTGLNGSIDDTALLHLRNTAGNTDDNTGLGCKDGCFCGSLEHLAQHFYRHFMVGNNAFLQRTHCHHIAGRPVQHIPGRGTDLQNLTRIPVNRHNGRFPDHQALAVGINQNVGCTQVYAQII